MAGWGGAGVSDFFHKESKSKFFLGGGVGGRGVEGLAGGEERGG